MNFNNIYTKYNIMLSESNKTHLKYLAGIIHEAPNPELYTDDARNFLAYVQKQTPEMVSNMKIKIANIGLERTKEFYKQFDPKVIQSNKRREKFDVIKQKNNEKKDFYKTFLLSQKELSSLLEVNLLTPEVRLKLAKTGCPQIVLGVGEYETKILLDYGVFMNFKTTGIQYYDVDNPDVFINRMGDNHDHSIDSILDDIIDQQKKLSYQKKLKKQFPHDYESYEDDQDFSNIITNKKGQVKAKSFFKLNVSMDDRRGISISCDMGNFLDLGQRDKYIFKFHGYSPKLQLETHTKEDFISKLIIGLKDLQMQLLKKPYEIKGLNEMGE